MQGYSHQKKAWSFLEIPTSPHEEGLRVRSDLGGLGFMVLGKLQVGSLGYIGLL